MKGGTGKHGVTKRMDGKTCRKNKNASDGELKKWILKEGV